MAGGPGSRAAVRPSRSSRRVSGLTIARRPPP
jgi:hypothetical protein